MIRLPLIVSLLLLSSLANAQLVDGEAFIKGEYLEFAVNSYGTNFSEGVAPDGYHYLSSDSTLGIVADPAKDGWLVGSPPYYGDYLRAMHSVRDYFGLQSYNLGVSNSTFALSRLLSYDFDSLSGKYTTAWIGHEQGFEMLQTTTLIDTQLSIHNEVIVRNTSESAVSPVAYMARILNPFQASETYNVVVNQASTGGYGLVYSDLSYDSLQQLSLFTTDTNARVAYSYFAAPAIQHVYQPTGLFEKSGSSYGNNSIAIGWRVPPLAPGQFIILHYSILVDTTSLQPASLAQSQKSDYLILANGVPTTVNIPYQTCPGDSLHLQLAGDSGVHWSWEAHPVIITYTDTTALLFSSSYQSVELYLTHAGREDTLSFTLGPDSIQSHFGIIGDDTILHCPEAPVYLTASGASLYRWFDDSGNEVRDGPAISGGVYSSEYLIVEGSNERGLCTVLDTVYLPTYEIDILEVEGPDSLCPGDKDSLRVLNNLYTSYEWLPNSAVNCQSCSSTQFTFSGYKVYTLSVTDSNGCTQQATQKVFEADSCFNNINIFEQSEISLYPNPASESFVVEWPASELQVENIQLYNSLGQLVYETAPEGPKQTIDVAKLAGGNYLLQLQTSKGLVSRKLQISR